MTKEQFERAMNHLNNAMDIVESAYTDQMAEYGDSRLNRPLLGLSRARIKLTQYGIKVSYISFKGE